MRKTAITSPGFYDYARNRLAMYKEGKKEFYYFCGYCGKECKEKFLDSPMGRSKQVLKKYCNKSCSKNSTLLRSKERRKGAYNRIKENQPALENFFSAQKDKFKDKIIQYKDSPSGKAYIADAKRPLIKNETFGYRGVLLHDDSREFIQCYECGHWYRGLSQHLRLFHGIAKAEYQEKYGFNKTTTLISDGLKEKLSRNAIEGKWKNPPEKARSHKKSNSRPGGQVQSTEYQNKFGTCPLQLEEKLRTFIHRYKHLPNKRNTGGCYHALKARFGHRNMYIRYGLPFPGMGGWTFTFPDGTVFKRERGRWEDRDELYTLMVNKCPFLQ